MKTKLFYFIVVCFAISSCSKDNLDLDKAYDNTLSTVQKQSVESSQKVQMQCFAEILSKAVFHDEKLRTFLKEEALKKIDNGYDIFYPVVKDKKIGNKTFKQTLSLYTEDKTILDDIENTVPLLNIHIPEIGNLKVQNLNSSEKELPVLYEQKIYIDGNVVDKLSLEEVPGFYTLVVCKNSKIKKKTSTRSCFNNALNGKYEYVSECFNPSYNIKRIAKTRTSGYDTPNAKYDEGIGYVPQSDIDPSLIEAYKRTIKQKRATRYLMYYNLNNPKETPTTIRPDVRDCIFRFKIAPDAFTRLKTIAEGDPKNGKGKPLFNGSVAHKKSRLSREEVLKSLLTGRPFCFLFQIEGNFNGNQALSERMKIYATPEKIFNLKINESRRHATMFRHTKYTYTIDFKSLKPKWYYPLDNNHDTRLNSWDISTDPIEKRVAVYLINPDEGLTKEVTETYFVKYITGREGGINLTIPIDEIKLGINGKLNSSNTVSKEITTKYKMTKHNEKIDEFQFDYFDDYPIEELTQNGYVIPIRKGRGIIETSILPISNHFYTVKRFLK